jgi:DNA-binding NtrC family response regulator
MKNIRVLIVDDDESVVYFVERKMRNIFPGCEVKTAYNKEAALRSLRECDFDLITLDGNLQEGCHGRQIIELMTYEQIKRTIVYSAELNYISECYEKGMAAINKNEELSEVLLPVLYEKGLIQG